MQRGLEEMRIPPGPEGSPVGPSFIYPRTSWARRIESYSRQAASPRQGLPKGKRQGGGWGSKPFLFSIYALSILMSAHLRKTKPVTPLNPMQSCGTSFQQQWRWHHNVTSAAQARRVFSRPLIYCVRGRAHYPMSRGASSGPILPARFPPISPRCETVLLVSVSCRGGRPAWGKGVFVVSVFGG